MRTIIVLAILCLMPGISYAALLSEFCSEVPKWPRGQAVPSSREYLNAHVGTPVEVDFMKSRYRKKGWVLIDARGQKDRATGKIPKTVLMTSDYNNPELNEITLENFVNKVSRHIKKQDKLDNSPSLEELRSDYKYIIFCNGRKCHRSSAGACTLRMDIGIPEENLFLMLGGYPEWKAAGYPIR
jgi:rhodanese-related sulfurtransferase